LSAEQCDALNSRITIIEIISSFKDIAENKAVGPDGFLKVTLNSLPPNHPYF